MKYKCAICGKWEKSKYPIPDNVKDSELRCSNCENIKPSERIKK